MAGRQVLARLQSSTRFLGLQEKSFSTLNGEGSRGLAYGIFARCMALSNIYALLV